MNSVKYKPLGNACAKEIIPVRSVQQLMSHSLWRWQHVRYNYIHTYCQLYTTIDEASFWRIIENVEQEFHGSDFSLISYQFSSTRSNSDTPGIYTGRLPFKPILITNADSSVHIHCQQCVVLKQLWRYQVLEKCVISEEVAPQLDPPTNVLTYEDAIK